MYRPYLSFFGKCLFVVIGFFTARSVVAAQTSSVNPSASFQQIASTSPATGFIQHIVIIMQENRTFDHYFGSYPGARGIPVTASGVPSVCVPDPLVGVCLRPYHSPNQTRPALINLPFYIAGTLKIIYDLLLYFSFRQHLPPEERSGESEA